MTWQILLFDDDTTLNFILFYFILNLFFTLLCCLAGWMIKMFEMYYQETDSKQKDQTGLVSSNPTGMSSKGIFWFITKPKVVLSVPRAALYDRHGVGPRTLTFLTHSKRHSREVLMFDSVTQCLCSVISRHGGLRVILVLVFTWWTRWLMKVWFWDSGRNVSNETNITWIALFSYRQSDFCGPWCNPQICSGCNLAP